MSFSPGQLSRRGLREFWKHHLGTFLGVAICTAVVSGALMVGGVVKENLEQQATDRVGGISDVLFTADRFFRAELANECGGSPAILLRGSVANADRTRRQHQIQLVGVDSRFATFWPNAKKHERGSGVDINRRLAERLQLEPGDRILIRMANPSSLPREAPFSKDDDLTVTLSTTIDRVLPYGTYGNFSLSANPVPPYNIFLPLEILQKKIERPNRANLLLSNKPMENFAPTLDDYELTIDRSPPGTEATDKPLTPEQLSGRAKEYREDGYDLSEAGETLNAAGKMRKAAELYRLAGQTNESVRVLTAARLLELSGGAVEPIPRTNRSHVVTSGRIFIHEEVESAAVTRGARPVLTYFVNRLQFEDRFAPYSMVTALEPTRFGLPALEPGALHLNAWLANDLGAGPGDEIQLSYFVLGDDRRLIEKTNTLRVASIIAMTGITTNRALMPFFPGIEGEENCRDWDPSMPIDHDAIRDTDEEYWDDFGGAPKAFVSLTDGQNMWGNEYGRSTGLWMSDPAVLETAVDPTPIGFTIRPLGAEARTAARTGVGKDLGGYFASMSFFLVLAALILCLLLMAFCIEYRADEWQLYRAVGFPETQVQKILRGEFHWVILAGVVVGAMLGALYLKAVLHGLGGAWKGALGSTPLQTASFFRIEMLYAAGGIFLLMSLVAWWTSRRVGRRPADRLPNEGTGKRHLALTLLSGLGAISVLFVPAEDPMKTAMKTMLAGNLALVFGCCLLWGWIKRKRPAQGSLGALALRNLGQRPWRSLAVVAMLAAGCFLVFSVGVFQQSASNKGTGGFALIAETTQPIYRDLNTLEGREALALDDLDLNHVTVVAMRSTEGEEASCLNLNRASQPRVLGVNPAAFQNRFALRNEADWSILNTPLPDREIPAVGDLNSLRYALKLGVGDTLKIGSATLRIVGAVNQTLLQGNLVISDENFREAFPDNAGKRRFLIDIPRDPRDEDAIAPTPEMQDFVSWTLLRRNQVAADLTRELQAYGFTAQPTEQRLAELYAVQNTYIDIFQLLGGLGLILGSLGLGILCLRSMLERRRELAVMQAVGFPRGRVLKLLATEQSVLLLAGLIIGTGAGLLATWRYGMATGARWLPSNLGLVFLGCLLLGLLAVLLVVNGFLRRRITDNLRVE